MLISVIVPVYNTPAGKLKRCLNSILSGDAAELEVILVDDGSRRELSAEYQDICDSVGEGCIRYFRKENGGPALARNYGVKKALGEYATFVDADDYVSSRCFQQAASVIEQYHPDLVMGLAKKCDGDDDITSDLTQTDQPSIRVLTEKADRARLLEHVLGYWDASLLYTNGYIGDGPWARVFKRQIFLENQFDDKPFWSEDTIWNICLIKACRTVVICAEIWYAYAVYELSLTQGYRKNCMEEFLYRCNQELMIMERLWPESMNGIYIRVWREIYMLCRTMIFHPQNNMTEKEKYFLIKKAIQSDPYQKALRNICFDYPQGRIKRWAKKFLCLSMRKGWYPVSYYFLKFTS